MKAKILSILALTSMLLVGCQNMQQTPIIDNTVSASVREDGALYGQLDLFAVKNGGAVRKNSDGLSYLTPFFNEDVDYVSQAEEEYLKKLSVFLTGTTINKIRVIGYMNPRSSEADMTKTLQGINELFINTGVSAPITLTIGYPHENLRPDKRFEIDVVTN